MENPYLQYFIGFSGFQDQESFHPSLMTHFRKRLGEGIIHEINEWIAIEGAKQTENDDDDKKDGGKRVSKATSTSRDKSNADDPNQGTLLLDATCVPADIAYPTDLTLLNDAREKLEVIIDALHAPHCGEQAKPRTYREKARKAYLAVAKQRRAGFQKIRKAIGKQLKFVARNLRTIEAISKKTSLTDLTKQQYKNLLVIHELVRQQQEMYTHRKHQVEDRIVNIAQPHVRPMVRGKDPRLQILIH